jgi:RHS repeat-associated protein
VLRIAPQNSPENGSFQNPVNRNSYAFFGLVYAILALLCFSSKAGVILVSILKDALWERNVGGHMATPYTYKLRHDQNGRIVEKVETVNSKSMNWAYSYDNEGRLFEARLDNRLVCQCQYDRQGRRQQDYFPRTHGSQMRNYSYRMDNRLQQAGNNGYTHDKQGFRSIWSSEGKYTLYEYAPDYRLLEVKKPDDNIVFEFTHDDNGQREMKYRNGEMVEAYQWLDFVRLAGFHDGEISYQFAYNGEERTPYAIHREDGLVAYLFYDQVGSLRVVADHSGNVIKEVLYDPFGGIIEDTNPELRIPIGFAGGLHDQDLGFVRFGWRDYDTFTSRWTAPDPIGDAGGDSDWYGYCLDDPVNANDSQGLIFNWLAQQATKKIHKKINPMSPERIITEEADKEIIRLKEYGDDNATAKHQIEKMRQLKKSMDEEGLPSEYEVIKKTLQRKHIWPYNDTSKNEDYGR